MHGVWLIFEMFGLICVMYLPVEVFLVVVIFCPITFGCTHILFMDITVRWVVCCTNLVFAFMVLLLLLLLFLKIWKNMNEFSELFALQKTVYVHSK